MRHVFRLAVCAVLSLLVFANPRAGAETFRGSQLLTTPADPSALASGDLNGDGILDLVYLSHVGISPQSNVQVLLGRGDGSYSQLQPVPVSASGSSITVADVNGDGRPDVIDVAGGSPSLQVLVLLGNGDGTLQAPVSSSIAINGNWPVVNTRVGVGDINGDGALDLVVADRINAVVNIFAGDKTGKFTLLSAMPVYDYPDGAYLFDVNGDGHLDLLSPSGMDSGVNVYMGDGRGGFSNRVRYTAGASDWGILIGDVDGDGHPDIIASGNSGDLILLSGKSDGTFAAPAVVYHDSSLQTLAGLGDYNSDGIPDIAVFRPEGLQVLLGTTGHSFHPVTPVATGPGTSLNFASADFNRDGHLDIALATEGGIAVLLGIGDGTFPGPPIYDLGAMVGATAVADFNRDGHPDIAVGVPASVPRLLIGDGTGHFSVGPAPAPTATSPQQGPFLTTGDFNGDGKADIEGNLISGSAAVALGNGDGTFQSPQAEQNGSSIIADFNSDGRSDMLSVLPGPNGAEFAALLGQKDGSFIEVDTPLQSSLAVTIAAVGDTNGDGKPDVILEVLGTLQVWLGNGDGTFHLTQTLTISELQGASPNGVLADFDNDGHVDLLIPVINTTGPSQLTLFYGTPAGFDANAVFLPVSHPYSAALAADLNKDGLPDLVLQDQVGIATIFNHGSRRFGPETHYDAGRQMIYMSVADVNGDGYPDIIAPTYQGSTVVVFLNDPAGTPPGGISAFVTLSVSPSDAAYGQPVTLAATVQPDGASGQTPSGTVTFSIDGTVLGSPSLGGAAASLVDTAKIPPGTHQAAATYEGDANFGSSTAEVVFKVEPAVYSTSTTLTAAPASALASQTVRLSATVTTTSPDINPLTIPLSGFVTFLDGTQSLGAVPVGYTGVAYFDTALLASGSHSITATYDGLTVNNPMAVETLSPSTSSPVAVTIADISTSTTLNVSSSSAIAGTVLTFKAQVSSASGAPFGGVTILDGTQPLVTISLLADGMATFSTASLGVGTHAISASYNTNASLAGSASAPQTVTVNAAAPGLAPTLVSLNLTASSPADALVAGVGALASGKGPAQGTVIFMDNGSILGQATIGSNGFATLATRAASLQDGQTHHLTASYSGSAQNAPAVSDALQILLPASGAPFQVTTAPFIPIEGTLTASIQIQADATQTVHLSCLSGVPAAYACTFAPDERTGSGISVLRLTPLTRSERSPWLMVRRSASIAFACIALPLLRRRRLCTCLFIVVCIIALPTGCSVAHPGTSQNEPVSEILSVQATSGAGAGSTIQTLPLVLPASSKD